MSTYEKIAITITIITLAFGLIVHNAKISELENQIKTTYNVFTCNRGVQVMTPEGYSTTVCAP